MAVLYGNRSNPRLPTSNRSASRSARRGPPDAGPWSISRIARARPRGRPRAAPRGVDREFVRKRIDGGGRTVDCRIDTHCVCSRFRLLHCGDPAWPFSRSLQALPRIVTCPLLLSKYLLAVGIPTARPFQMPSPDQAASSLPDDPALLRIEGPIATITLNRPAAFNSIDLSIARKLEQLGAEVEAAGEIKGLGIGGEGRAFCAGGDLQTIGAAAAADTIAPVVGELLKHYHAFITSLRRIPKIVLSSVHGSGAGG